MGTPLFDRSALPVTTAAEAAAAAASSLPQVYTRQHSPSPGYSYTNYRQPNTYQYQSYVYRN